MLTYFSTLLKTRQVLIIMELTEAGLCILSVRWDAEADEFNRETPGSSEVHSNTLSQKLQRNKEKWEVLVSLCKEGFQHSVSSVSLLCQCSNLSLTAPLLIPPPLLFTPVG